MKRNHIFALLFLGATTFSCDDGRSSRQEAHEEVVEAERQTGTTMEGQEDPNYVQEFEVVAQNMQYNPNKIRVDAGRTVRITLVNRGDQEQNIQFELPNQTRKMDKNVGPGQQGTLEFQAPAQRGTYTFTNPVGDHAGQGMTGELIVE